MRIINISKIKKVNYISKFLEIILLQDNNSICIIKKKIKYVTKIKPSRNEINDINFAFKVCKYVKSNAIVIVKDQATIGIGAGQQNRLDSCKIASQKRQFQPKKLLKNAFFPFADGIKTLINAGVKTIVQPGGSIRDKEVIEEANKAKIKMIFTGTRHFNH